MVAPGEMGFLPGAEVFEGLVSCGIRGGGAKVDGLLVSVVFVKFLDQHPCHPQRVLYHCLLEHLANAV